MTDDAPLPTGRHDVLLVDAHWRASPDGGGPCALDVDCTFTAGGLKGTVVTIPLDVGSSAYAQLLGLLGRPQATAGDVGVEVAALAFPCTLVVADGGDGGWAVAFDA